MTQPEPTPVPVTPTLDSDPEPLLKRAAITAAVALIVAILVHYGLPKGQATTIAQYVVAAAAPLAAAMWARQKVWSPASVAKLIDTLTKGQSK